MSQSRERKAIDNEWSYWTSSSKHTLESCTLHRYLITASAIACESIESLSEDRTLATVDLRSLDGML